MTQPLFVLRPDRRLLALRLLGGPAWIKSGKRGSFKSQGEGWPNREPLEWGLERQGRASECWSGVTLTHSCGLSSQWWQQPSGLSARLAPWCPGLSSERAGKAPYSLYLSPNLPRSSVSVKIHQRRKVNRRFTHSISVCIVLSLFSHVRLFETPWTVAHQAPLSMGFSRQEYFPGTSAGVGYHFLLQGIFPTQGSNPYLFHLLRWQVGSLPLVPPGSPYICICVYISIKRFFSRN